MHSARAVHVSILHTVQDYAVPMAMEARHKQATIYGHAVLAAVQSSRAIIAIYGARSRRGYRR